MIKKKEWLVLTSPPGKGPDSPGRHRRRRPRAIPPPGDFELDITSERHDRILGCVLGAAIGDALGHDVEFMSVESIRDAYGPDGITSFGRWGGRHGDEALFTDDTQMAIRVMESLVSFRRLIIAGDDVIDALMNDIAAGFVAWSRNPRGGHRAPGGTCMAGCRRLSEGVPWREAGETEVGRGGGCGSVMRAHPFGLLNIYRGLALSLAAEHSLMTHGEPVALAACAGLAAAVHVLVAGEHSGDPKAVLWEAAAAADNYDGTVVGVLDWVDEARHEGTPPEQVYDTLRGWDARSCLGASMYTFLRHPDDPRSCLIEAANTPGDSDSIASVAGALVGARCGASRLPLSWIACIERRDELIRLARGLR